MPGPISRDSTRNTTRHREAGAASRTETRRRLLGAAGHEFAARGYHAATVTRIAARAGVTVPTLYLAWGSKRALLRAHLEAALAGNPDTPYAEELPHLVAAAMENASDDARTIVKQIAHLYRQIAERAALDWQLYRDAAATDPEIASDWQALQRLRHETFTQLIQRLPPASLRSQMTPATAVDTAWAIASPETYDLLIRTAEYTLDQYETWVSSTLTAALLRP